MSQNNSEEKIEKILEALESPSSFTKEELKELFSDKANLKIARSILYAKEALARKNIPVPDADKEWNKFEYRHKKKPVLTLLITLITAACITLVVLLKYPYREINDGIKIFESSPLSQTIIQDTVNGQVTIYIPRGMQKNITLPDGTLVALNAESKLTYDISSFGKDERKVVFAGEGLFEVAKDSIHPFTVKSGNLSTLVLGTVFNIKNYETESPKVTLLSGSLKVACLNSNESLKISPGEQVVLTEEKHLCASTKLQANAVTSWHDGEFYFDNQTLAEILCELGRWYNVSVVFKDKSSMNSRLHFKASRNEQLQSVIELLNYISKYPITVVDKSIFVGNN